MKNQTYLSHAVAFCAVAVLAMLAPAAQAGPGLFPKRIALEPDNTLITDPVVPPGGDDRILHPGAGGIVLPIKGPVIIDPTPITIKSPIVKEPRR